MVDGTTDSMDMSLSELRETVKDRKALLFKANIALLILCLDDIAIDETGILKSPRHCISICFSLRSVSICFM